jgi:hypothetical protein
MSDVLDNNVCYELIEELSVPVILLNFTSFLFSLLSY